MNSEAEDNGKWLIKTLGAGWDRVWEARPHLVHLTLFYGAYIVAAGLGQGLSLIPGVDASFWPPAGIFAAVLILTRKSSWPWWIVVGCLAELTCNAIWFHSALPFATLYFLGNALVATSAALMIRRFVTSPFQFGEPRSVAAFVVLGAGLAPICSATVIAATDVLIGKNAFWTTWPLIWLGDSSGMLVTAPLTLMVMDTWRNRSTIPVARFVEASILIGVIVGLGFLSIKEILPTHIVMLPPLLWASVRFRLKGAAGGLALTAVMAAIFTSSSTRILSGQPLLIEEKIISLQIFLGIAAISSLMVAVLAQQLTNALQKSDQSNAELEKRSAAALIENEERYRLALQAGGLAVWDTDLVTGVRHWTDEAMAIFDLKLKNGTGKFGGADDELLARIHPDDRNRLTKYHQLALSKDVFPSDFRIVRGDGEVRWLAGRGTITARNDQGSPTKAVSIMADVTERIQADLQAAQLAAIVTSSSDAILSKTPDGIITSWNGGAQHLFGYTADEMIGRSVRLLIPDDKQEEEDFILKQLRDGKRIDHYETVRLTKDGKQFHASLAVSPIKDAAGIVVGASKIVRDITERKRHEQHQVLLMNELNHRVKNTLATIQSIASQTIRSSPNLAEAKSRFESRLISLSKAHDVLTREKWNSAPLNDIVERAILPYRSLKKDRFEVEGPEVRVSAQMALAFAMALHELCTNAVKYGALSIDKGQVSIKWTITKPKSNKPTLNFQWREKGGPKVVEPIARGFGTKLVERSLASDLGGDVKISFARAGVICTIKASIDATERNFINDAKTV